MAKIKLADFVVAISGKTAGTIFSKNRGGKYRKAWSKPTNPFTVYKAAVKSKFGSLSQDWRLLTQSQITAWNAATANFKIVNVLGELITPSGINLYKWLNQNLFTIGMPTISNPPMPAGVLSEQVVSILADATGPVFDVNSSGAVPAGMKQVIEATPPQSPGKSEANNQYRVVQVVDAAGLATISIAVDYAARFGSAPPAGSKVFVRTKYVNKTTGESSTYSLGSTVVVP